MVISLLGSSGVKCQVADFSLVIDPPKGKKGSLTLLTRADFSKDPAIPGDDIISGPGEYEIQGVKIKGIDLPGERANGEVKTAYAIHFDSIKLGMFCALSGKVEDEELDKLGEIDILFADVEGSKLPLRDIASLVKKVDPGMVVATSDKGAKKLSEELGQRVSAQEKLTVKAKDFNKEASGIQLVWLKG